MKMIKADILSYIGKLIKADILSYIGKRQDSLGQLIIKTNTLQELNKIQGALYELEELRTYVMSFKA